MAKYNSLREYIQDKEYNLLVDYVKDYVVKNYDGNGKHSINVYSLCDQKVDNLKITSIQCNNIAASLIHLRLGIQADIVTMGLGTKKYEADRLQHYFSIQFDALIQENFQIIKDSIIVSEYEQEIFDRKTAVDEFLIPYLYGEDLEEIAADFTAFYCQNALYHEYTFPVDGVLQNMELEIIESDLPKDTMGRMYFKESRADIYTQFWYPGKGIKVGKNKNHIIKAGTILINKSNHFMGNVGSTLLTIAHEMVHWELHRNFFKILSILDNNSDSMACSTNPIMLKEDMSSLEKAMWFAEWQANALAIRIVMPDVYFVKAMKESYKAAKKPYFEGDRGEIIEDTIRRVGILFGVSPYIAKQRAIQLGCDIAIGTYVYVDGKRKRPFYFKKGSLGEHQTFIISPKDLDELCKRNSHIRTLLELELFVFVGDLVCINNPKYLCAVAEDDLDYGGYKYKLTGYARDHVDECCLVFDWESTIEFNGSGGFYGQCYLSKNVCAEGRVEYAYDHEFSCNQSAEELSLEVEKLKKEFIIEDQVLKEIPNTFHEALKYHMKRKKITIEELAFRAGVSEKSIKNYRSGKIRPTLRSLMAIFNGLKLKESYCDNLLDLAGLSLKEKGLEQKAYRYLLREHPDSDLAHWNKILKEFGLDLIPDNKKINS